MADGITTDKGFFHVSKIFPSGVEAKLRAIGPKVFGNISECSQKIIDGVNTDVIKGESVNIYGTDKADSIFVEGKNNDLEAKGGNDIVTDKGDGSRFNLGDGDDKLTFKGNKSNLNLGKGNDTAVIDGDKNTIRSAEELTLNGDKNTVVDDKHRSHKTQMRMVTIYNGETSTTYPVFDPVPVYLDFDKIDEYEHVHGLRDKDLTEVQKYAQSIENNGEDNRIKIEP
jgi:hypothetical protein